MDLEDYLEPEVAVTAVVAATVFSPRARQFLRRGAVYSAVGALAAGEALSTFFRGFGQGLKQADRENSPADATTSPQSHEGSPASLAGGQER
ncbi:hypothetical protein [Ktedonospora formicarum]|uniref:Uncharacterized protein n=1 Tax=Ktedonospora formicarum TaxID=2778364 RepID=A0A8J3I3A0_9CHLR|nr:hypothetical protein [Ktedonospora formicarum]GHO46065.1 hypothetical protein KSX_42280 [Ktedonospora formicarum]